MSMVFRPVRGGHRAPVLLGAGPPGGPAGCAWGGPGLSLATGLAAAPFCPFPGPGPSWRARAPGTGAFSPGGSGPAPRAFGPLGHVGPGGTPDWQRHGTLSTTFGRAARPGPGTGGDDPHKPQPDTTALSRLASGWLSVLAGRPTDHGRSLRPWPGAAYPAPAAVQGLYLWAGLSRVVGFAFAPCLR